MYPGTSPFSPSPSSAGASFGPLRRRVGFVVVVGPTPSVVVVSPDVASVVPEMFDVPSAAVPSAAPFLRRVAVVPGACGSPPSAVAPAAPFPRRVRVVLAGLSGFGVVASPDVSSVVRVARDDPAVTVASAAPPRRRCW